MLKGVMWSKGLLSDLFDFKKIKTPVKIFLFFFNQEKEVPPAPKKPLKTKVVTPRHLKSSVTTSVQQASSSTPNSLTSTSAFVPSSLEVNAPSPANVSTTAAVSESESKPAIASSTSSIGGIMDHNVVPPAQPTKASFIFTSYADGKCLYRPVLAIFFEVIHGIFSVACTLF